MTVRLGRLYLLLQRHSLKCNPHNNNRVRLRAKRPLRPRLHKTRCPRSCLPLVSRTAEHHLIWEIPGSGETTTTITALTAKILATLSLIVQQLKCTPLQAEAHHSIIYSREHPNLTLSKTQARVQDCAQSTLCAPVLCLRCCLGVPPPAKSSPRRWAS